MEDAVTIMGQPEFSIVTASFNQGKFIGKSIDSVRKQKPHGGVEHIILDNISNDETPEHLAQYKNNPDEVDLKLYIEKDGGQTAAINRGFLSAKGRYISWLNTDEFLHDGALQKVAAVFDQNPDVDIVFGDCRFVDVAGNVLGYRKAPGFSEAMLLYYGCYLPSCTTFIRKKVIDDGQILDPYYRVTMDYEYYVRLSRLGYKFKHIPEVLCDFTWHETNISIVQNDRRIVERDNVKNVYSKVRLPDSLRYYFYIAAEWYWKAYRFAWRRLNVLR